MCQNPRSFTATYPYHLPSLQRQPTSSYFDATESFHSVHLRFSVSAVTAIFFCCMTETAVQGHITGTGHFGIQVRLCVVSYLDISRSSAGYI